MFQVDYNRLVDMFPDNVRKQDPTTMDWLKLAVSMFKYNMDNIVPFYNEKKYTISHTYQVSSIEHLINTTFPLTTDARIEDVLRAKTIYTSLEGEKYVPKFYTSDGSESPSSYTYMAGERSSLPSFVIIINSADLSYTDAIYKLVYDFVAGGKKFTIEYE